MADTGGKSNQQQPARNGYASKLYKTAVKYAPYVTAIAATNFTTSVMSPLPIQRSFGSWGVIAQNTCFGVAHVGAGLCIYSRIPPKKFNSCAKSVLASATGSVIFNYGCLLLLANIKLCLPSSQLLRSVVGLGVIGYLLWMGNEYLNMIGEVCPVD